MYRSTLAITVSVSLMLSLQTAALGDAPELRLAHELAEEEDWEACIVESRRHVATGGAGAREAQQLLARAQAESKANRSPSVLSYIGAIPVRAMVAFYRQVVAPALGARCSLHPSCSAYSLQAARERGWLGLPMTADRLIPEPTVVTAGKNKIIDDRGRPLYPDPVSDHIGGGHTPGTASKGYTHDHP